MLEGDTDTDTIIPILEPGPVFGLTRISRSICNSIPAKQLGPLTDPHLPNDGSGGCDTE